MASDQDLLIVGGYGVVGRRLEGLLAANYPGRVIVAGRHPEQALSSRTRRIDLDDASSIEAALDGVGVVVACARQREPHLLRACVRRGLAYTSIAPPRMGWADAQTLDAEARRTGARVILAAGIEPGISSVLARVCADRVGKVEAIETALLLSVGDSYGVDSMGFLMEELTETYEILVAGQPRPAHAFAASKRVRFPGPIGALRAYTIPFRDQLYYPHTLGAQTAIARIAIDPPWIAWMVSMLVRLGGRSLAARGGAHGPLARVVDWLRARHAGEDRFALLVEVHGGGCVACASLLGRGQAQATAIGVGAIAEALASGEVSTAGVYLAEQVIEPTSFFERLSKQGLVPVIEYQSRSEDQARSGFARPLQSA